MNEFTPGEDYPIYDDYEPPEREPTKYKHPICRGSWGKPESKFPATWKRKKRKCPCCGRMISSKMEFALHGDQRKKNVLRK